MGIPDAHNAYRSARHTLFNITGNFVLKNVSEKRDVFIKSAARPAVNRKHGNRLL